MSRVVLKPLKNFLRISFCSYFIAVHLFVHLCLYNLELQDCLLIHIAALVQLRKFEDLFILAHQLVDSQPDNEVSWYTVGCYYYSIGQLGAAKNFFSKFRILSDFITNRISLWLVVEF